MKHGALFFALALLLMAAFDLPAAASAQTPGLEIDPAGELEKLNLERVEKEATRFTEEIRDWAPGLSFRQLVLDVLHGDVKLTPAAVMGMLGRCFWGEVWGGGVLLGKILILAIILAILQQFSTAFERGSTSQIAFYAGFLVLAGTVVTALGLAIDTGREAVDGMVSFVQALLPVLLTLLAAAGGLTTAAILHPAILTTLAVIGTLIKNAVLPLITFGVILSLIDRLSEGFEVSRLSALFRNLGLALLGVLSTVFLGVLTVQGVAGAASAGIALRTAKYATGAFVPVVGGMLADAFEAVVGTSLLLKSAVGIAGMVLIFFAVAFPAVKICALSLLFKLAGAMVQPLEGRVGASLDGVGNGLLGIFAVVATVGLLSFFAVGVIVGLGYLTTMLR
ncbi:MAG: stage III sporulation protein AE [Bacillota bacterium]